jgi:cellulose synthase/poly-beta-1,6-N-acetylglucosamine synthase-like glycosyltransferase
MLTAEIIFWILMVSVFYVYIGYGLILYVITTVFINRKSYYSDGQEWPDITLFITAYNERDFVKKKMQNCYDLDYPDARLKIIWVTDGSDDGTETLLNEYTDVQVYHQPERRGKIAAMNRGMEFVKTPLVVFCDANTLLNNQALKVIAEKFNDHKVGCVAGEKRIISDVKENAASSGEGIYWKYESMLKQCDARLYSAVGAAGELFAIRTELFREVEPDTLLDDFVISLRIVEMGYRIEYSPYAYASETSSASVNEELKRKIRISAGGIQSVMRLGYLLNPFKYGVFAWQFLSHKVLRWLWVPFVLPVIFVLNIILVLYGNYSIFSIYNVILILQLLFYTAAMLGWMMQDRKTRLKMLFAPYYIFIMNYSVYLGLIRYLRGRQTVNWERAKRAS